MAQTFSHWAPTAIRKVKARKEHPCGNCKVPIQPGEDCIKAITPPWYGDWDGDADENGRPFAIPVNTGKWKTEYFHPEYHQFG